MTPDPQRALLALLGFRPPHEGDLADDAEWVRI